jgi:predicted kinase
MEALGIDLWDAEKRSRVEALQWKQAQELLERELTVIIEWGTWARAERDALRFGARELGAAVELHVLTEPVELLLERIERRGLENPRIDRDALERWSAAFEAPTAEEMDLFDAPMSEFQRMNRGRDDW